MKKFYLLGLGLILSGTTAFSQYCTTGVGPTSAADTNVEGVVLNGDATNIAYTGCAPAVLGVEDQTIQSADLTAGNSYSVNVTWGTCGGTYYGMAAEIWIDFNGSQTFDAGESIGTDSYGFGGGPLVSVYNFTVPAGALNGTHRMRVMQYEGGSAPLNSCETGMTYGSITDFSVVISGGSSCGPATALSVSNNTGIAIDLNWTPDGAAVNHTVEWGVPGFTPGTGAELGSALAVVGGTTNATGLTVDTDYEFYVQTDCGGPTSSYAGPFAFFTGYCQVSTTSSFDYLSGISTTGADQNITYTATTQPAGSYADETASQIISYPAGSFDITTTYVGGSNGVNVWVDWNNDFDFDDIGENVFFLADGNATKTGTITVPGAQALGNYRMRVRGQWGTSSNPPACGSVDYGSTVDFTLVINAAPTCPTPTLLASANSTTTSTELSWTENGTATSWVVEYGAVGFAQGSGTTVVAGTNVSYLLSGLTINNTYDIYVRSFCSVGDTSNYLGPIMMDTYDVIPYTYMATDVNCPTAGYLDISATGTAYDISDDGEQGITLDFPIVLQGALVTEITIGNNGGMEFGTLSGNVGTGGNMTGLADGVYPWLDDLDSETGDIFYEVLGAAPNRTVVIQWETICNYSGSIGAPTVTFQVQMHETTNEIYVLYDDVIFGGANVGDDFGSNADIGLAGPNQDFNISNNDPTYLMNNSCIRYYYPTCPEVSNITSSYSATDSLEVGWTSNGTETSWIIEYGPTGFTPGSGTVVNTTTNPDTLGGLLDNTQYDIYVSADCGAGDTSAVAGPATFITDIVCPAPTGFGFTYTSNDTAAYTWTPGGLETSWNIEFGTTGFIPGTGAGTASVATIIPDSTFGLTPGTVYEFYIQADCGAGVNNPWTGPITYVTPIVNDSTCDAVVVPVDGSTTVYANIAATTQIGTPVVGFNTVWFEFVAPASGNVEIRTCGNTFDNFLEVYEASDCSAFGTFTNVDIATGNPFATCAGTFDAAGTNLCGLTAGNTYYLVVGSETDGVTGTFPLTLTALNTVEAGTAVPTDVCEDNANFDLFTAISGNTTTTGQWYNPVAAPGNEFASAINVVGAPAGIYTFDYVHSEVCGSDTVSTTITVVELPNVGTGSVLPATCNFGAVSLFDGLSGNVDLGGTWTDGTTAVGGSLVNFNGEAAGTYDYHYVVDNGVCSADSSTVTVTLIDCLTLEENEVIMNVYPNPVRDILTIQLMNVDAQASIELYSVQGRLVYAPMVINNSNITMNMSAVADGVYILKVTTNGVTQEVRVVKK